MTGGLLLVGASGLAREVLAAGITGVVGVLDDNVELHGSDLAGVPVLGPPALAAERAEQLLVCVGPSAGRRGVREARSTRRSRGAVRVARPR